MKSVGADTMERARCSMKCRVSYSESIGTYLLIRSDSEIKGFARDPNNPDASPWA